MHVQTAQETTRVLCCVGSTLYGRGLIPSASHLSQSPEPSPSLLSPPRRFPSSFSSSLMSGEDAEEECSGGRVHGASGRVRAALGRRNRGGLPWAREPDAAVPPYLLRSGSEKGSEGERRWASSGRGNGGGLLSTREPNMVTGGLKWSERSYSVLPHAWLPSIGASGGAAGARRRSQTWSPAA